MNVTFSKVFSATIEAGKRILKVKQFGVKTAKECYPFGFDSMPPENLTAIFAETSNASESVIVGYINKNQLEQVGASRMYSVDANGATVAYLRCGVNGDVELNGNAYTAVRFNPLKNAIDAKDAQIVTELGKIATAIGLLGGTYTPGPVATNYTNVESQKVKLK